MLIREKSIFHAVAWYVLTAFVTIEIWYSFIPLFLINYLANRLSKPKCEIDYIKKYYTLFAITSAFMTASILALLWSVFKISKWVPYLIMFLYVSYIMFVSWLAYRIDPTIEIAHLGNERDIQKFTEKLNKIKIWTFWGCIYVFTLLFPKK